MVTRIAIQKYISLLHRIVFYLCLIIFGTFSMFIYEIKKLKNEHSEYTQELSQKIDSQRRQITSLEIDQRLRVDLIQKKVTDFHKFLSRLYPNYDYQSKFDNTINNIDKETFIDNLNKMPEDLLNAYVDNYLLKEHGIENYQLSVPKTIYPIESDKAYVTHKNYEFGMWHPLEGIHSGVDINNKESAKILASADGYIWKSYYNKFGGNTIELKFTIEIDGKKEYYFDRYRHVKSILVETGQEVKQGDVIAGIGNTGQWSFGSHLHWERYKWENGKWVNINPFLNSTYGNKWKERN